MSHNCASSLVYLVQVLWHGLEDTTNVGSFGGNLMLTPPS